MVIFKKGERKKGEKKKKENEGHYIGIYYQRQSNENVTRILLLPNTVPFTLFFTVTDRETKEEIRPRGVRAAYQEGVNVSPPFQQNKPRNCVCVRVCV